MHFKVGSGTGPAVEGDTQDAEMKKEKAMELISFGFRGENTTNIGSSTGGTGGAGKVSFDKFYVIANAGTRAAADLVKAMALGGHYDDVVLTARRSGKPLFRITFKLVIVAEVEIEGTRGDSPVMNVVLDWGAMLFETFKINPQTGATEASTNSQWSRVNNTADLTVE